jgi:hypothetical protein
LNPEALEVNLTQTIYYFAQYYAREEGMQIENGILCSAKTLQRQLKTGKYEVKDFCKNCISLGDYFTNMGNFAQSEYVL